MDNCCGCSSPPPALDFCSVMAQFIWPGMPALNSPGIGDTAGVTYLTLTWLVTVWSEGTIIGGVDTGILDGGQFTFSISYDPTNGSIILDTLTGTAANPPAGILHIDFPTPQQGTLINPTRLVQQDPFGRDMVLQLSNPKSLASCQGNCSDLLGAVDLMALAIGNKKLVTYDQGAGLKAANFQYPTPNLWKSADGSYTWYWADRFLGGGSAYTVSVNPVTGAPTFTPFQHNPIKVNVSDSAFAQGCSLSYYEQEQVWMMQKVRWATVNNPVCCETDGPVQNCAMIQTDGQGNLILLPPTLAPDTAINSQQTTQCPNFVATGTSPGGVCPCA